MTPAKTNKNGNLVPSVLSDFFDSEPVIEPHWFSRSFDYTIPAVNIKETGKDFSVEFAAPGFKKHEFKIHIEGNNLIISAEREEEKSKKEHRFTRKEFSYNSFSRSFALPQNVNTDHIDAKYIDGILKLSIPKKEEAKHHSKKEIKVA
ncbi:MAG: Hsp20/alpha crystallin family protein [Bacteroidota bacterium]